MVGRRRRLQLCYGGLPCLEWSASVQAGSSWFSISSGRPAAQLVGALPAVWLPTRAGGQLSAASTFWRGGSRRRLQTPLPMTLAGCFTPMNTFVNTQAPSGAELDAVSTWHLWLHDLSLFRERRIPHLRLPAMPGCIGSGCK